MSKRNYSVYKLLFPRGEVYIGKTNQRVKSRWSRGQGYSIGSSVREAIDKYGWENVNCLILYENLSYEEANKLEHKEIEKHGGVNHPLVLNNQTGGDSGYTISERSRKKMSETAIQKFKDRPELIENMSKKLLELYQTSPELWASKEVSVNQYSYDGTTFIASYDSIKKASVATGIEAANIEACLYGRKLSAGGFRWTKHGKIYPIIQFPTHHTVRVAQLDDFGNIIAEYDSITDAVDATGINKQNISACLYGKRYHAGGYVWKRIK